MLALPQVKQNLISTIKNFVYELPLELPKNIRLRISGNSEILDKISNLAANILFKL